MLVTILLVLIAILLFALGSLVLLVIDQRKRLVRFNGIDDASAHLNAIKAEGQDLTQRLGGLKVEINKQKSLYQKYAETVGAMKSATEATNLLRMARSEEQAIRSSLGGLKSAAELQTLVRSLEAQKDGLLKFIGTASTIADLTKKADEVEARMRQAEREVDRLNGIAEVQSFGLYERTFEVGTPKFYSDKIEKNLQNQKDLVKAGLACFCSTSWTVEGSAKEGKKMVDQQIKLMLRAFNGECDAAIAKVRATNIDSIIKRIQKSWEAINKMGETKKIEIAKTYLDCKIEEANCNYSYELAKDAEKEQQREARELERENERAEKEILNARKKAEKDEQTKAEALEEARRLLAAEHGAHNEKLESLVQKLEQELKDAIDRKAKAIARAQLTKSGHVYVLSNIGTMGPDVYKIGMTRRLEPLDRIKELGDASVPFPFDVHALIYAENAPQLEHALHLRFADRRLNLANTRKEYFRATLAEIHSAVKEIAGEFTFRTDHAAEQFRKSEQLRQQGLAGQIPVVEDTGEGDDNDISSS